MLKISDAKKAGNLCPDNQVLNGVTDKVSTCFFCIQENMIAILTFRHRASSVQDRRFATLQRVLFIYKVVQI